jgi:hypothetical protein
MLTDARRLHGSARMGIRETLFLCEIPQFTWTVGTLRVPTVSD